MSGALWAITSYFNPAGYRRRLANYRMFRRHLAVPLLAVELAGARAELTAGDADILVQCHDGDVLWQKERLLNHALAHLPAGCTHVAWIDCDLVFGNADWPAQAERALAAAPLVQLFSELRHAPRDADESALRSGGLGWAQPALAAAAPIDAAVLGACMDRRPGTPALGMAWAARRDWLQAHGLYDRCIVGGGDTALACAAFGHPEVAARQHRMNAAQRAAYLTWAAPVHAAVGGRVGHVAGTVHHLWHGELQHRQGAGRHAGLASHDFDPQRDLVHGRDGAWRWAREAPALHRWVRDYFAARREDG
jgi:hypothetical protein